MKLKTLKDIYEDSKSGLIAEGTLKAEAVKIYKKLSEVQKIGDTLFKKHGKIAKDFEVDIYDYEQDDAIAIKKFLVWWANLTEDDLK